MCVNNERRNILASISFIEMEFGVKRRETMTQQYCELHW
jgi:hypothetical protein